MKFKIKFVLFPLNMVSTRFIKSVSYNFLAITLRKKEVAYGKKWWECRTMKITPAMLFETEKIKHYLFRNTDFHKHTTVQILLFVPLFFINSFINITEEIFYLHFQNWYRNFQTIFSSPFSLIICYKSDVNTNQSFFFSRKSTKEKNCFCCKFKTFA